MAIQWLYALDDLLESWTKHMTGDYGVSCILRTVHDEDLELGDILAVQFNAGALLDYDMN